MSLLVGFGATVSDAQPVDPAWLQQSVEAASTELRIDPETGRHQLESALKQLHVAPDADTEIRAHLALFEYYLGRDRAAAEAEANAADQLLIKASRPGLQAGVLTSRAKLLVVMGDSAQAAELYDRAASIAEDTRDDEMLAEVLLSRGYLRELRGDYAHGLADLRRAQALFEQNEMPLRALLALNAIAIVYNRMGDASEATHIFERTLEALHNAGFRRDEAVTLLAQGEAYENLQQFALARSAFQAALELARQMDNMRAAGYALRGLASVASENENPNGALSMLDRAADLQQQISDARLQAQIELTRGIALHRLSRLRQSHAALSQALTLFHQIGSQSELATTYGELAAVSGELGNWRDAYEYRSLSQTLTTQLLRSQLDQRFATLKVEYDTASKEKENELLIRENVADQAALAQRAKAGNLQTAVIVLVVLLLGVLATLALHQRRASSRLRLLAMTDELTGVPNRRAVLTLLSQILRRSPDPISILIIDLDHFKSINDRHGHLIGDEALKRVAADLRDAVIDPAFFGRLGGEEFAAVLPATRIEAASAIAELLRERVLRLDLSRWLGDRRITVSIGIATSLPGRDSVTTMLRRADSALYSAKDAGRNCVRTKSSEEGERELAPRVA
ncbi:MAG TPA: diguanylate cyclase [Steroidobacteraceae bacterium]|nr:diguanylate cyclase [Steroidobacteraceae bacterium]